jgi:uncharacterized protein (TIGR03437 family)
MSQAKSFKLLGLMISVCAPVVAQFGGPPLIEQISNAASYALPGFPNSGIAQGSIFVVLGTDLSQSALQATSFPLPKELGGTAIRVTVQGVTVDALMLYTFLSQVAAVLPSGTPVGHGTLVLTSQSKASDPQAIEVVGSSFGVFSRNQAGAGPGIVQNVNSELDRPVNSLTHAAHPNQTMIIWGTGLGAVSGDEAAGPLPGNLNLPVDVFVGGKQAKIAYAGRSGCCAGLDQIVFDVPVGVEGCYVPVAIRVGDRMSNFVTMSIARDGDTCNDLIGFPAPALAKLRQGSPLRLADVLLGRLNMKLTTSGVMSEVTSDFAVAAFTNYSASDLIASLNAGSFSFTAAPLAPGACEVLQQTSMSLPFPVDLDPVLPKYLNAGSTMNVTGPLGARPLDHVNDRYIGALGGLCLFCDDPTVDPEYLAPGNYSLTNGSGGQDVGGFQAKLAVPASLTWTNRDGLTEVSRNHDLTLTWTTSGLDTELVTVFGISVPDASSEPWAALLCSTPADAGQLTVPSWVLSAMPPSATSAGLPLGFLGLMNSSPASGSATTVEDIDVGRFQYGLLQMNSVAFR